MAESAVPSGPGAWWREAVIAVLAVLVVIFGGMVVVDRWPDLGQRLLSASRAARPDAERVAVLDVVLDREHLRTLDVVFDRPLGTDRIGQMLGRDPAVIRPKIGGLWRWQAPSVLRFEPSGAFAMATEYEVTLLPEALLDSTQAFATDPRFAVRTDQFRVQRVDVREDPVPDRRSAVVLRGEVRFNYAVDPRLLAGKMQLVDPLRGTADPVPVALETSYTNTVLTFRSDPVAKEKAERELRLVILADLTPAQGNVSLGGDYVDRIRLGSRERLVVRGVSVAPGERESTIRLAFSSPVSSDTAARYLKVAPEVRYRLAADRNELVLTGAFVPGAEYELTVGEGLQATDESVLAAEAKQTARLPDLPPVVELQSQGSS